MTAETIFLNFILDRPVGPVFIHSIAMNSKDTKKDHLLEIASQLFYKQGYHATGIKQIIDAAGIAKGTFYSHFKSKEELGVAWLQKRHREWNEWRENYIAQKSGAPREQLLSLFAFLGQWMSECDYRGCAFLNTMAETPDANSPLRKEVQNHKDGLRYFIRRRVDSIFSEATDLENEQKADVIFLLFESALVESQNFRSKWPIDIASKHVTALLA